MERKLSSNHIESYCANVIPLRLLGVDAYSKDAIAWGCSGDSVQITSFAGEESGCFSDGVLLTLLKPGSAVVTVSLDGVDYHCNVVVREMKRASSGKHLHYYIGDLHDHTSKKHFPEEFQTKEWGYPADLIRYVRDEGKLDFCVISDHACLLNHREYFRGYADTEDLQPMDLVVFPGCEAEITNQEADRYGVVHNNAGEIVTLNACNYAAVPSWEDFYRKFDTSPFAVSILAHPQTIGFSSKGVWNFCLHKNNTPRFRQMVKLVEMGNGSDIKSNLINEYVYSVALDNGFRVSPSCSSDCHGTIWGYTCFPGKSVIMAPERSKEAFTDALMNNRVYACSTGNLKLFYSVCGVAAPGMLPLTSQYDFRVEVSCFYEDPSTIPVKCQVISDYGICVKEIENFDAASFDFTVESETARYFYLRLIDSEGRKTWSAPVWTGRAMDETISELLRPLNKAGFTAVDEVSGADASRLLNDDPSDTWFSEDITCSILIDMHDQRQISGLGHYPQLLDNGQLNLAGLTTSDAVARFPYAYRISTSWDGKCFKPVASGVFRIFSGEDIIRFEQHTARFVKLEILSTTGANSERSAYKNAKIAIAELTLYEKG